MADRVAVLRAGRIEQVGVPDKLYAEPASAFVHEFLGESVRFDCMVGQGLAAIPGLPDAIPATDCPPGPAIALIRPQEICLRPVPGPAHVDSVHASGPLRRVRISLTGQMLEVPCARGVWTPAAGASCNLDLSRARIYSMTSDAPLAPQNRSGACAAFRDCWSRISASPVTSF